MKALAEQISELDGIVIYGRVVGVRGRWSRSQGRGPCARSRSARVSLLRRRASLFLRGRGIFWWQRAAHALRATLSVCGASAGPWSPRLPAGRRPARSATRRRSPTIRPISPVLTRAATYADMEDLIRLGAYAPGAAPKFDEAIRLHKPLEAFLAQGKEEATSLAEGYRRLAEIVAASETER